MTIDEIYKEGKLSVRAYNVCRISKVKTINDLKELYINHGSFESLPTCGHRTSKELIELCQEYMLSLARLNKVKTTNENLSVDEIFNRQIIKVRCYNVCKDNNLLTINDLHKYYLKHGSFEKLRNCGRKSNEELVEICKNYQTDVSEEKNEFLNIDALKKIITNLSKAQREVINNFIFVNTNKLSTRSRNAVFIYLGGNLEIENFAEKILLSENFDLENIGVEHLPELENYILIVKFFLLDVSQSIDEKPLIISNNSFLIEHTLPATKIPNEILEPGSIFLLTDFLFRQNTLFDEKQMLIIKRGLKVFENSPEYTLDEIVREVNLPKERVRQIRKSCIVYLFDKLMFIRNFNKDLFQNYGIDTHADQIEINSEIVTLINTKNNTNFSKEFICYLLFIYLNKDFSLIGNTEDVLIPKFYNVRNRHNWNNFYLVNKEIVSKIDFTLFVNDISKRLKERIKKSYAINFNSYLSAFIANDNIAMLNRIFPVAEKIINKEFGLYLDSDNNILFERNTIKQVHEYAIEALEELDEPASLDVLYKQIETRYPGTTKSKEALRGSMNRVSEIIHLGRSSTYGLKKWERERNNIKGGTIRKIVFDYLRGKNTPVHICEILEEIYKYGRDTNAKSVIRNLETDSSRQFVIFSQRFVGLRNKKYYSNLVSLPRFLGMRIISFVRKNKNIELENVVYYFSRKYKISKRNANYIIQQLIDNKFISINDENKLGI